MYCQVDLQNDIPICIIKVLTSPYLCNVVEKQNFIFIQMYFPFIHNEVKTQLILLTGHL